MADEAIGDIGGESVVGGRSGIPASIRHLSFCDAVSLGIAFV